MIEIILRLQLP